MILLNICVNLQKALNSYQTKVPLFMVFPTVERSEYTTSSHYDVVPTIMDYMGLNIDTKTLFSGKSLLRFQKENNTAVTFSLQRSGYPVRMALVMDEYKFIFFNQAEDIVIHKVQTVKDQDINSYPPEIIPKAKKYLNKQKKWFKDWHLPLKTERRYSAEP